MTHLIDKDALVAEIKSRIDTNETCQKISGGHEFYRGAIDEAKEILCYINTLEVKEVDMKLTLEDVSMIRQIIFDYNRQVRNEMSIPNDEEYCKEVLKRFKAQKGEKKGMKCPEPNIKDPCYFCYNGECYATHWWECSKGFRKPHEGKKGNKNNRYCKKGE